MRELPVVIIIALLVITSVWAYRHQSPQRPFLEAYRVRALSLFPDGKVVVVSTIPGTNMGSLAVYSPNGTQLWNLTFGRDGTYWDSVLYAKVSPDGRYIGVMTTERFMLYEENGTLLWKRKNPLSGRLWSEDPQWASVQFTNDSRYIAFAVTTSKGVFSVFSINGSLLLNGRAEGLVGMELSKEGIYLLEDSLFSVGLVNSRIVHYGFDGSSWSLDFPSGSPRGIDVLETPNGTYVAYADCGLGISLIKEGTVVWKRDNGTCYWDVVFWNESIYTGSERGIAVYSLNGTLINTLGEGLSTPWTFLPRGRDLVALHVDRDGEKVKTGVYLVNRSGLSRIWEVMGRYVGDNISHAFAEYRRGKLLLGTYGDEGKPDRIYLLQVGE